MNRRQMCFEIGIREEKKINQMIENMTDDTFNIFYNWIIELRNSGRSENTISNYRPKVRDCLISSTFRNRDLASITSNELEEYFLGCITPKMKPNTYQTIIDYNKSFFSFACPAIISDIDWETLKLKKDELEPDNPAQSLDARIIDLCRDLYSDFNFIDKLRKRFIFEVMLQTDLTSKEIGELNYNNFVFKYEGDEITYFLETNDIRSIPKSLYEIATKMNQNSLFNFDTQTYVSQMKIELKELGVINFKRSDLDKTRETRFMSCPQCGQKYEAVPENWCLRNFYDEGQLWIVCRRCGTAK